VRVETKEYHGGRFRTVGRDLPFSLFKFSRCCERISKQSKLLRWKGQAHRDQRSLIPLLRIGI
jgi:hypothetical protein